VDRATMRCGAGVVVVVVVVGGSVVVVDDVVATVFGIVVVVVLVRDPAAPTPTEWFWVVHAAVNRAHPASTGATTDTRPRPTLL
jgi:hypothetical protein